MLAKNRLGQTLGGSRIWRRQFSVETVQQSVEPLRLILENAQQLSGLSWPLFIPLATCVVRFVTTTPLAIYNRRRLQRQRQLQPLLGGMVPVIKAQLAQTVVAKQSLLTPEQITVLAAKERRKRRIALYKEMKCQNWKVLVLPAVQIPVFIAMSLAVRSLVGFDLSRVTEFGNLDQSAFAWFKNIVEPDPWGVLPLAIGSLALGNVELNALNAGSGSAQLRDHRRSNTPSVTTALANISKLGSVLFMAISFQAPLALQLYWCSSNAWSLLQNLLLDKFMPFRETISYPKLSSEVLEPRNNTKNISDSDKESDKLAG